MFCTNVAIVCVQFILLHVCITVLVTDRLPYSVRTLLESSVRNCDNFHIKQEDVTKILDWEVQRSAQTEIAFRPARVILQDFT